MKNSLMLLALTLFALGCSAHQGDGKMAGKEKIKSYFAHPTAFIKDPHFSDYKMKREALESEYLQKKISYVEYIEQKNELDANYTKEVQEREDIIRE